MESDLKISHKKLDKSVVYLRWKLRICPLWYPRRSRLLSNLANTLSDRFRQSGRIEDLEAAIGLNRQALEIHPPGHPDRSASLNDLACTISTRFNQLGRIEDIEEAITCNRQALALRRPSHPHRSISLNNLAVTLSTRFDRLGRIEDLNEAYTYHRQALALRPPGDPDRSGSLNNLAIISFTRFEQSGQIEDLEEAITSNRQALALRRPGHPYRSISLNNLAISLTIHFDRLGQTEDLDEALTFHQQSLALRPTGHPNRPSSLNNFANALSARFNQLGRIEDLEEAITCNRLALALLPPGHPGHSCFLNNLADSVSTRFNQLGDIEDLEEAIKCSRQGLALRPPGHPDRSSSLNNLANAVSTRFNQLGRIEDLEEAISCNRQALAPLPLGHPDQSISLNNLANNHFTRFGRLGQIEDLEGAITYHRQALALLPPEHPERSISLNNLASVVSARFSKLGQIKDLEEAITCNCQALDLLPPGHPNRFVSLDNLAIAISIRFRRLGRLEDLDKAIKYLSEVEDNLPISHPLHTRYRSNLASIYLLKYNSDPHLDDCLLRAFSLFDSAANHSSATSKARFDAARRWAQEARSHQHHSTIQAYSQSLTLLDRYLNIPLDIESQQHLLATTSSFSRSLASDAASSAIDAGQLETAVELLEQGRSILWSKLRGYRHPLERLRDIDWDLADRFETLSGLLERHAMSSEPTMIALGSNGATFDAKLRTYRLLSREWDRVVERIRQIDGFAHFLRPVPFSSLQMAAAEGPVIIVNISEYRSDAIILCAVGLPVLVPLPDASPGDLVLLSSQLSAARTANSSQRIPLILQSLWNTIVHPVTNKLAALGVTEKSRIWWCPTSELCGLPLHAAGPYTAREKNLPDIYISSYTPTLSTLIGARSGIVSRLTPPKLLVMGQPRGLPRVQEEINRVRSFGDFVDVLVAEEANRQTVFSGLERHNWIHFACHGHLADQPFRSSFELHNQENFTLIDLITARLPNAELAFLSACHSAAGDKVQGTPDEVISLAAAVQFCGFRSVVGTLWAMADIDGPDVAEDFYAYMFRNSRAADFRDSATALNLATRAMRKRKAKLDQWINFIHIGA